MNDLDNPLAPCRAWVLKWSAHIQLTEFPAPHTKQEAHNIACDTVSRFLPKILNGCNVLCLRFWSSSRYLRAPMAACQGVLIVDVGCGDIAVAKKVAVWRISAQHRKREMTKQSLAPMPPNTTFGSDGSSCRKDSACGVKREEKRKENQSEPRLSAKRILRIPGLIEVRRSSLNYIGHRNSQSNPLGDVSGQWTMINQSTYALAGPSMKAADASRYTISDKFASSAQNAHYQ